MTAAMQGDSSKVCFTASNIIFQNEITNSYILGLHTLTMDGQHIPSLDELMEHYVGASDGGSICLICGKLLHAAKRNHLTFTMKRHIREIHLKERRNRP